MDQRRQCCPARPAATQLDGTFGLNLRNTPAAAGAQDVKRLLVKLSRRGCGPAIIEMKTPPLIYDIAWNEAPETVVCLAVQRGVRPFRWTASCCGFDQALGVLILEVDGTAITES